MGIMPVNEKLKRKNRVQAVLIVIVVLILIYLGFRFFKQKSLLELRVRTKSGEVNFYVEVAETFAQRALGLMYRKNLPKDRGMLFIYSSEGYYPFWMKNTYIPLDIIFISADKRIVDIAKNTTPLSTTQINSKVPFKYALEINGGLSDKFEIEIGQEVLFEY